MNSDTGPEFDEHLAAYETNFARNMKLMREERGWSQADLVERLHSYGAKYINQSAISRIELGTRPVRLGEARWIANAFSRSIFEMTVDIEGTRKLGAFYAAQSHSYWAASSHRKFLAAAEEVAIEQKATRRNLEQLLAQYDGNPIEDAETQAKLDNLIERMRAFAAADLAAEFEAIYANSEPRMPSDPSKGRYWYGVPRRADEEKFRGKR